MSVSLNVDFKKLNITLLLNSSFKIGCHSKLYDYKEYRIKTTTGGIGLGFLSIYYAKTTHY